ALQDMIAGWSPTWLEASAAAAVAEQAPVIDTAIAPAADCWPCRDPVLLRPFLGPEVSAEGLRLEFATTWTLLPLPETLATMAEKVGSGRPLWSRGGALPKRDPQFLQPIPTRYPIAFDPLALAAPRTLKELETLWDTLADLHLTVTYATEQAPFWIGVWRDENLDLLSLSEAASSEWPTVELRLEPMADMQKAVWRDQSEHQMSPDYGYVGHTPWGKVDLPVEVGQLRVHSLSALIQRHGKPWQPHSFAFNFPELSALTLDVADLGLEKVMAYLRNQAKQAQKDVTLFGLSVPAVVVAKWGGPILVIVQVYFLLHLRRLRDRLRGAGSAATAPWIGVYPDRLSKAATAVTAFVLPPVLLGLIIGRDLAAAPVLGLVVLLSLVIALLSFRVMRDLWPLLQE
ncbi:MAG: hypothetical protein MI920_28955, partial [Kiloniellales bacterium]|nr:hypothetical protein [Kiloniellales bacterium]